MTVKPTDGRVLPNCPDKDEKRGEAVKSFVSFLQRPQKTCRIMLLCEGDFGEAQVLAAFVPQNIFPETFHLEVA